MEAGTCHGDEQAVGVSLSISAEAAAGPAQRKLGRVEVTQKVTYGLAMTSRSRPSLPCALRYLLTGGEDERAALEETFAACRLLGEVLSEVAAREGVGADVVRLPA